MISRLAQASAICLALAGCGSAGMVAGTAMVAPTVVSAMTGVSPTVLSDVAAAGCAAQAAANVAGQVALQTGNQAWAGRFSDASKLAGLACAW